MQLEVYRERSSLLDKTSASKAENIGSNLKRTKKQF